MAEPKPVGLGHSIESSSGLGNADKLPAGRSSLGSLRTAHRSWGIRTAEVLEPPELALPEGPQTHPPKSPLLARMKDTGQPVQLEKPQPEKAVGNSGIQKQENSNYLSGRIKDSIPGIT